MSLGEKGIRELGKKVRQYIKEHCSIPVVFESHDDFFNEEERDNLKNTRQIKCDRCCDEVVQHGHFSMQRPQQKNSFKMMDLRHASRSASSHTFENEQDVTKKMKDYVRRKYKDIGEKIVRYIEARGDNYIDVYKTAEISPQLWHKYMIGESKPGKDNMFRMAVVMDLDLFEARQFLNLAGFSFSDCSQRDLAIEYFLPMVFRIIKI